MPERFQISLQRDSLFFLTQGRRSPSAPVAFSVSSSKSVPVMGQPGQGMEPGEARRCLEEEPRGKGGGATHREQTPGSSKGLSKQTVSPSPPPPVFVCPHVKWYAPLATEPPRVAEARTFSIPPHPIPFFCIFRASVHYNTPQPPS